VKGSFLPLGIDLGSTRIRVAAFERRRDGGVALAGVATRDVPDGAIVPERIAEIDLVAAIIDDARTELGIPQRRCVLSLPAQAAVLRLMKFPRMSEFERRRAARFEAERFSPWDAKDVATLVRAHWVNRQERLVAVGLARSEALHARVACARRAGLRVVGVDHDACAVHRAFPFADAVLDVGLAATTLHTFSPAGPVSRCLTIGGVDVTLAIGAELSIDAAAAERRKRILGTAGAGESARDSIAAAAAEAIAQLRERANVRRIAMTGNGARLTGLAEAVEASTGAMVDVPVSDLLRGGCYPDDVTRSAAPDWTLAASLGTWSGR
jgi:Tfp pilus assembly PilM family ATPase